MKIVASKLDRLRATRLTKGAREHKLAMARLNDRLEQRAERLRLIEKYRIVFAISRAHKEVFIGPNLVVCAARGPRDCKFHDYEQEFRNSCSTMYYTLVAVENGMISRRRTI